jgi:hypothetical protein
MLELVDLKPWMAASSKVFWNEDPAPLSVPLPAAAAGLDAAEDAPVVAGGVDVLDDEFDEHAAMASTAMAAPPAARACLLPRSCMWGFSLLLKRVRAVITG